MAMPLGLPPPEPLKISDGNMAQKWDNHEVMTGVMGKEQSTRVATLLTVIGKEAVDVYNTFIWNEEVDHLKMAKVLEKFEIFCNPRKNTIYEHCVVFKKPRKW